METQPIPQGQRPAQTIIRDNVAGNHLRLGLQVSVHGVERVIHVEGVDAGDIRARKKRVDHGKVGYRDVPKLVQGFCPDNPRHGEGAGTRQQSSPLHHSFSLFGLIALRPVIFGAFHIECVVQTSEGALVIPTGKVVMQRAAQRKVLRNRRPLAPSAEVIHQTVEHLTHIAVRLLPAGSPAGSRQQPAPILHLSDHSCSVAFDSRSGRGSRWSTLSASRE